MPPSSSSLTRLLVAHLGLALVLFLATTDTTIVATSLPTVLEALHAPESQYSWPGVAYFLPQTALQPLFPRFSDVLGRKRILYASIVGFIAASLLCGTAKNMTWLILARGAQGVASGGIDRSKWSQALSFTWCASAIAGPLLGGLFSGSGKGTVSWRWGFFINGPIGVVGTCILWLSLPPLATKSCPEFVLRRLPQPAHVMDRRQVWGLVWKHFDFVGMILLVGGSTCVIVGVNAGVNASWSSPGAWTSLSLGCLMLLVGAIYETRTSRDALIPPALFQTKPTLALLTISFLHNVAFTIGTFYLALYFQAVQGSSPLMAGVRSLPYSLGSSLASFPVAWYISGGTDHIFRKRKYSIVVGLAISALGFGLLILLDARSSLASQVAMPLVAGIGVGMLFHAPFGGLTSAMPSMDVAGVTGTFFFVRFIGSTLGLSIANAIFNASLRHDLPGVGRLGDIGAGVLAGMVHRPDLAATGRILPAITAGIQKVWMFAAPSLLVACCVSLLVLGKEGEGEEESEKTEA